MTLIRKAALSLAFGVACLTGANAGGFETLRTAPPAAASSSVLNVEYNAELCRNWNRECSRLWGRGSEQFDDCMNQPAARWDCGQRGRRGGGGGGDGGLCGNWRRECARLHGWRTRAWHQCMHQPDARADCGR